jgi:predicted permease
MARIPGLRRIFRIALPRADVRAVDAELSFHIESRVAELVAQGIPEPAARIAAERAFGDRARYRRDVLVVDHQHAREVRMRELAESVWMDLRQSWRALRLQPGFALVAVGTLALGIGATTSVFSAVSGVLLRPLPYAHADRIVHLGERDANKPGRGGNSSYDNFVDWRRLSHSFEAMGLYNTWQPTLTDRGEPERVQVAGVSAGMFDVFHVTPTLGRRFVDTDNADGAAAVAVVTHEFWRSHLGSDPAAVGQTLMLNFTPAQIVGVLPEGFVAPGSLARPIWLNFSDDTDGRSGRSKTVYALLRPDVTLEQARAEMTRIGARLGEAYPKEDGGSVIVVDRLVDRVVGDMRRPLYMLLAASFFVLLIACANLSNLLLARGVARSRELAVRSALGAGRPRIVRQLLTESLLLAIVGSVCGVLIAALATRYLVAMGPTVFATRPPVLDFRVLGAAIASSVATTILFGLLPALRGAPRDVQATLRATSGRVSGGRTVGTRSALAVLQLSLAVVLLSASAMVVKSFARVLHIDPGIRGDHLLTMSVNLPRSRYDSSKSTVFYEQLRQRLEAIPGVRAVAFTSVVPFGGDMDRIAVTRIAGEPERTGSEAPEADRYVVSPSYFGTMGVRLVRGRLLEPEDRYDAPVVCVVDEVFARRAWGGRDPIGGQMKLPQRTEFATIVGVVTHVKTYGLDVESPGQIYMSHVQYPYRWSSMVVRTAGDPAAFAPTAARVIHELDRDQPVSDVRTMDDLMAGLLRSRQFTLALLAAFAAVAVTLAVVGLYGVIAYGVSQRRREFGIRVALGAQQRQIARMVVGEGGRIAVIGAVIGIAGAMATSRVLASLLFEVSPRDAGVLGLVSATLIGVAMLACVVPARRATQVDAAEVLRGE